VAEPGLRTNADYTVAGELKRIDEESDDGQAPEPQP